MMDMDALLTGETYDQLPDTYVIFICDFAPFDSRLYRYNIRNVVRETNELLKDGNQTIILQYTRNESIGSTGGIGEFSEICWSGYG